jgi:Rrf2 family iron-sulfur cluster assembly transcriptional regulator
MPAGRGDRCGIGAGGTYASGMDLTLSRKGDYAVRAALCLAEASDSDGYLKIREIAAAMDLPVGYTPHVLRLLANAGLAEARAGREGGYRLARRPGEITLLEVVEAAEGGFALDRCIMRGGPCHWEQACAVHPAWSAAIQACRDSLGATSLADLATGDERLRQHPHRPGPRGIHSGPRRG